MAARRCVFSALAESDLAEVANYIESYNPRAALKLVGDIRRLCATLTENPARHRLREEYGAGVRVAVLGKYLVFSDATTA